MSHFNVGRRTFLKGVGEVIAASAVGAPLLAGCGSNDGSGAAGPSGAASATPVRGGKATLAIQDVPVNMDPADGQLYSSLEVYQNIFSELISETASFTFEANLASAYQQEDEKTWRFDLVDNAVFQNGEPVTANDVKYTVERQNNGHGLSAFTSSIGSVEVINSHSVRFRLKQPYGPMEATVAGFLDIVNEKAVTGQNPKLRPIGCGPYKMTEWVQGDHVTLTRWEKYFKRDKPYLDQVTFRSVGDDSVRLSGLQTGQFDWIQAIPGQQVANLMNSSRVAHTDAGPFLPYWLSLNVTKPPFNDQRVRQAIAWAINRDDIVKLAFFGQAVAADELVSKPNPWYSGANPFKGGPDLDKAKDLLRQAGVGDITVPMMIKSGIRVYAQIAQVVQSQLKQIGINVTIEALGSAQYIAQLQAHTPALTLSYFSASNDPGITYLLITSNGTAFDSSGPMSDKLIQLVNKFVYEGDPSKRKAVNADLVTAFSEEAAYIPLVNQIQRYWTKPTFHSASPLPTLEIRLEDMWKSG